MKIEYWSNPKNYHIYFVYDSYKEIICLSWFCLSVYHKNDNQSKWNTNKVNNSLTWMSFFRIEELMSLKMPRKSLML